MSLKNAVKWRLLMKLTFNVVHFAGSIVLGYHSIPKVNSGSFRGRRGEKWGSFWARYHLGVDLGIISGLGIISRSRSFRGCRSHLINIHAKKTIPGKQVRIIEVNAYIPHLNYHFVDKNSEWIAYDSDE